MNSSIKNIIYIHTHDMGRYISPYGYAVATPNLHQFSQSAALFRQAFCCGPTCSPSRAGLLTGVTPHQSGMLGLAHLGFKLSHPEYHLGAFLKQQGFLTALCGTQHEFEYGSPQMPYEVVAPTPQGLGFLEGTGFLERDRSWTQSAVDFLEQDHDRRFFLSFGLFYPHRPYVSADYDITNPAYIRPPDPLPDLPGIRRDMADYHHTVRLADECIGRVLETIRSTGRDKDSLIIVTTDHGIAFPEMKCHLSDHGIGVTLMMNYPGNPQAGQTLDALVSHLDVYPTVCDLLGLEAPGHLQGHTLRPLLEGSVDKVRDEIFSEVNFHAAYEPLRCIRTKRYKLIRRFSSLKHPLANCDESDTKTILLGLGWGDESLPPVELYDLITDPHETCNLACSCDYSSIREKLECRLQLWMQQTNDPLLNGSVPRPAGAIVCTPESVNHKKGPWEPIIQL
jgi:arylsulfatase A-like enzyme